MEHIGASDPVIGPGQYLYRNTHAWWAASAQHLNRDGSLTPPSYARLVEHVHETWVPQDHDQEWLHRRTRTGNYRLLFGSEPENDPVEQRVQEYRAVRGEFFGPSHPGGWQTPNPEFLAALPDDPAQLFQQLREATEGRGLDPDLEMLVYVADVLRHGLVPANVRTNLYRTLEVVPGLEISGDDPVVFGITRKGTRQELLVDRATGQVSGERITRDGVVWSSATVRTKVVDHAGDY